MQRVREEMHTAISGRLESAASPVPCRVHRQEQMDSVVSPLVAKRTLTDFGGVPTSSGDGLEQWKWRCSSECGGAEANGRGRCLLSFTAKSPKTVREVEREAHEAVGHTPYRVWRAHCVAGAGRRDQHLQTAAPENANLKPVIAADYDNLNDQEMLDMTWDRKKHFW